MSWPEPCPACGDLKGNKGAHNRHVKACTFVWTPELLLAFGEVELPENLDECWMWQKYPDSAYPYFSGGLAHRAMYELFHGAIPRGRVVCHSCDAPRCVNPKHLWLGTQADNLRDAVRKGRHNGPRKAIKTPA